MITVTHYIILSAALFIIGAVGVLIRRNAILMLMSVELMLNAANLVFVAFARHYDHLDGQVIAFLVMTVCTAQAAVGLGLIVTVFKTRRDVDVDEINSMLVQGISRGLCKLQSGYVRQYALAILLGVTAIMAWFIFT